ncbi:uncharacterized protein B0H18DRAFT_674428 [Fomitopsis serialis]|uniref:uncharacterized protein n=1 Tax=Fomitopsis serialis TaxID=139415 RepID=UPI0020080801|nr:uncharacterized protein B0H18DRAFT_674428 [Neoantrodia serialis]KAH9933016.1 hypothetical protein B0H18DRAFT_674428 [Neoantrodia serialis]
MRLSIRPFLVCSCSLKTRVDVGMPPKTSKLVTKRWPFIARSRLPQQCASVLHTGHGSIPFNYLVPSGAHNASMNTAMTSSPTLAYSTDSAGMNPAHTLPMKLRAIAEAGFRRSRWASPTSKHTPRRCFLVQEAQ